MGIPELYGIDLYPRSPKDYKGDARCDVSSVNALHASAHKGTAVYRLIQYRKNTSVFQLIGWRKSAKCPRVTLQGEIGFSVKKGLARLWAMRASYLLTKVSTKHTFPLRARVVSTSTVPTVKDWVVLDPTTLNQVTCLGSSWGFEGRKAFC